jgi:hypothetical protein
MTSAIDKPDVAAIMKEIREGIRERRERGFFTHEDVEEETLARLRNYAADALIDPRLLERFLTPGHSWNIATDYFIRSHRSWPWGPLSILIRKIARPFIRLYTDHVLNRQTQINQYFLHVLHHTVRESTRLRYEVKALSALISLDSLTRRQDASPGGEPLSGSTAGDETGPR